MTELNWEKESVGVAPSSISSRLKFGLISAVLIGVIGFLLVSGTANSGRYFITVHSLLARPDLAGKTVKITGAVVGSTIKNNADQKTLTFTVAHITDDATQLEQEGGLAKALHVAVTDVKGERINVVVANQAMPDLLRDEAQAIMTGKLGADGVFYADELLLKCPSRYQSDLPKQAAQQNGS